MKNIVIVGAYGKMGKMISSQLENDFNIVKIGSNDNLEIVENADLIIDFASAKSSINSVDFALKKRIPIIVGSTGHTEKQLDYIKDAGKKIVCLLSYNFSLGIFKLKQTIDCILKLDIQDIAIVEKHHIAKKDSPSGTALMLLDFIKQRFNGNVQVLSERGGKEIGTHKIDFYFNDEVISITHQAFSRQAFVDGVIFSVNHIFDLEVGFYDFDSLCKLYK